MCLPKASYKASMGTKMQPDKLQSAMQTISRMRKEGSEGHSMNKSYLHVSRRKLLGLLRFKLILEYPPRVPTKLRA